MEMDGKTNLGKDTPQNVQTAKGQDIDAMKVNIEALKRLLAAQAMVRAGQANETSIASAQPGTTAAPPTVDQGEEKICRDQDSEENGGGHKPGWVAAGLLLKPQATEDAGTSLKAILAEGNANAVANFFACDTSPTAQCQCTTIAIRGTHVHRGRRVEE